ncbi:unnamed protein product [Owenia fusiformis]|uniref:Uncharacterized protein n=1 Tax=Owenia fusiformis TaxID=6347 RepID=A0A8S4N294_OWEFU|nr:unnamed protein product [Owenia fusiformis]
MLKHIRELIEGITRTLQTVGIMDRNEGRKRAGTTSDVVDVAPQSRRRHGNVTPEEDLYLYEHMQTKKSRREQKQLEKESDIQPLLSQTSDELINEEGDNDSHEKQDNNSNKLKSMYDYNDLTDNLSASPDIPISHQNKNSQRPKVLKLKDSSSFIENNTKGRRKTNNSAYTKSIYTQSYNSDNETELSLGVGNTDFGDSSRPETPSCSDVDGSSSGLRNMTEFGSNIVQHVYIPQSQGQFHEGRVVIERMLEQIDAEKWRRPLRNLLSVYYMEQPIRQAIGFLTHMFDQAVRIAHAERSIDQLVDLDVSRVPPIFNLDHWHSLVLALGFNIEEPDTCKNIRDATVFVPVSMKPCVPEGFLLLLQSLADLGFYDIRTLLSLDKQHAQLLLHTISEVSSSSSDISPWIGPLWEMHQGFLEKLGFTRVQQGSRKHFTFNNNAPTAKLVRVYNVLCGMYGHSLDIFNGVKVVQEVIKHFKWITGCSRSH